MHFGAKKPQAVEPHGSLPWRVSGIFGEVKCAMELLTLPSLDSLRPSRRRYNFFLQLLKATFLIWSSTLFFFVEICHVLISSILFLSF